MLLDTRTMVLRDAARRYYKMAGKRASAGEEKRLQEYARYLDEMARLIEDGSIVIPDGLGLQLTEGP